MKYAILDGAAIRGRQELHEVLARQLDFPAWYGKNLDALFDCLTTAGEELVLRVENPGALEENLGGYARTFFQVLAEARQESPRFRCEIAGQP